MRLIHFDSEQEYLRAQYRTRHDRDRKRRSRIARGYPVRLAFYLPEHFEQISRYVDLHGPKYDPGRTYRIMCHGARCGGELKEMQRVFPGARVSGTDLLPRRGSGLTRWDFRKKKLRWVGRYHLVYSNSLDHSDQPLRTVRVWLRQLVEGGKLFVEWTKWHNMRVKGGDCFAASFDEYIELFETAGKVHDIIYAEPCRMLIIAGR